MRWVRQFGFYLALAIYCMGMSYYSGAEAVRVDSGLQDDPGIARSCLNMVLWPVALMNDLGYFGAQVAGGRRA